MRQRDAGRIVGRLKLSGLAFDCRRGAYMSTEDGSLFIGPHDGKELPNRIGGRMVVKVRDEDTAGTFSIHDNTIPPGSPGPRPHIYRHHEEAFYVLEGELIVRMGPQNSTH